MEDVSCSQLVLDQMQCGLLELQTFSFYKRKEFPYHLKIEVDAKDDSVVYDIHIIHIV